MAFIVWRAGRYAELLHSVRDGKRVRQVRLAWLGARPTVTEALKEEVAAAHPQVHVDWKKIEEALDKSPAPPDPGEERFHRLVAAVAEPVLHDWLTRYHRRIRRERVEVVEREWWPAFRQAMLSRPDLPDLLMEPDRLHEVAYRAVAAVETSHERRRRDREEGQRRQQEVERAQLVAAIDATLKAIQNEYTDGLEWARNLLGAYPSVDPHAGEVEFLRAAAAEAVRRRDATFEASDHAVEVVLSAAQTWSRSGHLPARLWDEPVRQVPVDVPTHLIGERARILADEAGLSVKEAERNAQVLLNLLDTRRRDQEQFAAAPVKRRGR